MLADQQAAHATNTATLVLERLYYAEGRHDASHPLHGKFDGLSVIKQAGLGVIRYQLIRLKGHALLNTA